MYHGDKVYVRNIYWGGTTYLDAQGRGCKAGDAFCVSMSSGLSHDSRSSTWVVERIEGMGVVRYGDACRLVNKCRGSSSFLDVLGLGCEDDDPLCISLSEGRGSNDLSLGFVFASAQGLQGPVQYGDEVYVTSQFWGRPTFLDVHGRGCTEEEPLCVSVSYGQRHNALTHTWKLQNVASTIIGSNKPSGGDGGASAAASRVATLGSAGAPKAAWTPNWAPFSRRLMV